MEVEATAVDMEAAHWDLAMLVATQEACWGGATVG